MHVPPWYRAFATYHAEFVMTWYEALDHFDATRKDLHESAFRSAIKARDKRLTDHPAAVPILILGTMGAERVLCDGTDRPQRARPFACERWPDIYQRTRQGTQVCRAVRGLAWCDSVRNRRSASLPNAPTIGQTTHGRNPTVNCEQGLLGRPRQARPTDSPRKKIKGRAR